MRNLIDRARLPFQRNVQLRKALYRILGRYPHNLELYREALAHRSLQYRGRHGQDRPVNNERLEYLGDAILEATVSDVLYHHFPNKREGFLTNTRSKMVQRETLNRLAARMGMIDLLHSNVNNNCHNSNLGGNTFEALVGALYLDHGYEAVRSFVENKMTDEKTLNIDDTANKETNFKSKLLEWAQKNKLRCDFRLDKETQKDGSPEFLTSVIIEDIVCGQGHGFSKKQSEQEAARQALARLRHEQGFKDSVFGSKEKRTAMEAEEYAALPRIAEIEHTTNAGTVPATGKKKPVRTAQRQAKPAEKPAPKAEAAEQKQEKTAEPKDNAPKRAPKAAKPKDKSAEPKDKPVEPKAKATEPKDKPVEPTPQATETAEGSNRQGAKAADPEPNAPRKRTRTAKPKDKPAEAEPQPVAHAEPEAPQAPTEAAAAAPAEKRKRPSRRHRPAKRAPGTTTD